LCTAKTDQKQPTACLACDAAGALGEELSQHPLAEISGRGGSRVKAAAPSAILLRWSDAKQLPPAPDLI